MREDNRERGWAKGFVNKEVFTLDERKCSAGTL
jgi:hypothetical protein